MNGVGLSYPDALALVESGHLLAIAAGTRQGRPCIAWYALPLDTQGVLWATHPDDEVKVSQMLGAVSVVAREARRAGFVTA